MIRHQVTGDSMKAEYMLNEEFAVSRTVGSLVSRTKWNALEKLSTIVRIIVLPSEGGSLVIKSNDTWDQGLEGTSNGCRSPARVQWDTFPLDRA